MLKHPIVKLIAGAVLWLALYSVIQPFSQFVVERLPLETGSRLFEALAFFLYDTPKIFLLLSGVVFVMGTINTWFEPERTRVLLQGRSQLLGHVMAAGLGVLTPFCSCSAVPLFIGFVQAGIPLGVTFSFLIAAPMVNEIALGLLFALFGFKVAGLYLVFGLLIAIVAGWVLQRLKLEHLLEKWVQEIPRQQAEFVSEKIPLDARFAAGWSLVREVVGKVWIYILLGISVGAFVHGYVPEGLLAGIMGAQAWWSVPLAVLLGIPMYSNAAGILPVVESLLSKGAALGTALAFMMSVVALSLPEMIILRKVLSVKLIGIFITVVGLGILSVGFLFNLVF